MAVAISQELRQPLTLELALDLTICFARAHDDRFDRATVRWLARLGSEQPLTLTGIRIAAQALAALPDPAAERVLRELARRR